jgi:hypothetical protein
MLAGNSALDLPVSLLDALASMMISNLARRS